MECSIINPALSLLMKHLVIGQPQKAPIFLVFHWSPHGSLVAIGQHLVIMRIVHLRKRTKTSLITESDRSGHTVITESDQAVHGVQSCNGWFLVTHQAHIVSCFSFHSFICVSIVLFIHISG